MKRLLLSLTALIPIFVLAPHVSAHFPATSGTINAILHIEPDDYPTAGSPQTLYLILSDSANRFNLASCACELSISKNGQPAYYTAVKPPPAGQPTVYSTAGMPYTFPAAGNYQIMMTGQPLHPGSFQPFTLNWNFQIPAAPNSGSDFVASTFLKYFAAIAAIFLVVGIAVFVFS